MYSDNTYQPFLTLVRPLQKRTLRLRHKLDLVTTSHECAHVAKEIPRTAAQIMEDGDAMASTTQQAETAQRDILESSQNAVPAMEVRHRDASFKSGPGLDTAAAAKCSLVYNTEAILGHVYLSCLPV